MAANKRKVCKFCLMMRFLVVFMAIVALFVLNGLYRFWS